MSEDAVIGVMLGGYRKVTQIKEPVIMNLQGIADKMQQNLLATKE